MFVSISNDVVKATVLVVVSYHGCDLILVLWSLGVIVIALSVQLAIAFLLSSLDTRHLV